jgi:HK97 family phage major capsid protein
VQPRCVLTFPLHPCRWQPPSDNDILRSLLRGETRGHTFERRNTATPMSTSADAEMVPEGFYGIIQEILRFTGPAFQPGLYTILNTATGNDIKVPRQTAFSAATATAEGAQFAVSNPTGESFTLKSQKVGVLLKVSSELITDNEVNLVEYLGRQAGEAVGYKVNELLAVGTGTVQPQGIFGAAASGVVGTAAGGTFTADNLIDLLHSVDSAVAARPAVAFQMNRATLGAVRKLKDGGRADRVWHSVCPGVAPSETCRPPCRGPCELRPGVRCWQVEWSAGVPVGVGLVVAGQHHVPLAVGQVGG